MKQRIKIVGYDANGVARVWGSHDTCEKTAYALCKEAAVDYVEVRPDRGLVPLQPSNIVTGRKPRVHHASPGPDRWKERSRTLPGIAGAMADQWAGTNPTPYRSVQ